MGSYTKHNRFEHHLNVLLESSDIFATAQEKLKAVDEAKDYLNELQSDLRENVEQIHGQLAIEVRRANDVWLDRAGNVCVKYGTRARLLRLRADTRSKTWVVGDNQFERQFEKYNHESLASDAATLAKSIALFFRNNYKTMRNDNATK